MGRVSVDFFFKIFFLCEPFFFKSSVNLLQYCFCLLFWVFGREACGILVSWPGIEPTSPALKGEIQDHQGNTMHLWSIQVGLHTCVPVTSESLGWSWWRMGLSGRKPVLDMMNSCKPWWQHFKIQHMKELQKECLFNQVSISSSTQRLCAWCSLCLEQPLPTTSYPFFRSALSFTSSGKSSLIIQFESSPHRTIFFPPEYFYNYGFIVVTIGLSSLPPIKL